MKPIETIQIGESWGSAIKKVNALIAGFNELAEAVGGGLVEGRFDYNALANKPTINMIVLAGNRTHRDLSIALGDQERADLQSEVVAAAVESIAGSVQQQITAADIPGRVVVAVGQANIPSQVQQAVSEKTQNLVGKDFASTLEVVKPADEEAMKRMVFLVADERGNTCKVSLHKVQEYLATIAK